MVRSNSSSTYHQFYTMQQTPEIGLKFLFNQGKCSGLPWFCNQKMNLCVWGAPSNSSWWKKVLLDESGRLISPLLSWMNWLCMHKEGWKYILINAALTVKECRVQDTTTVSVVVYNCYHWALGLIAYPFILEYSIYRVYPFLNYRNNVSNWVKICLREPSTYHPHSPGPAWVAASLQFGRWRYVEGWPAASWKCCCCCPF